MAAHKLKQSTMPKIIDNININLSKELKETLSTAKRADFCVGYFNLRGWGEVADMIDDLKGEEITEGDDETHHRYCRLLVGMHKTPDDLIRDFYRNPQEFQLNNAKASSMKKRLADEFRRQLTVGYPTATDKAYLIKLSQQIKDNKLIVKLFLQHTLHAKLYLAHTNQRNAPIVGFVGSSNLTMSGLVKQGELNVDVVDGDASQKLSRWFNERWDNRWCLDISEEIVDIIDNQSWVEQKRPYFIYLKIAYHLAQEARAGLNEFKLPKIFSDKLLDFQQNAVKIAAHHLNKRNGVLIGDVVGLGKTITAAAIIRIFQDDFFFKTLIICPPNLKTMWNEYKQDYDLNAEIMSIGEVINNLRHLKRYRLVVIDESHNLRNSEGKRYKAIKEYIQENECKVMLLSATPYNKSYIDLSNQLGLFIPDDLDLGISPEKYVEQLGGTIDFAAQYPSVFIRSIKAFELSDYTDDWRELLRFYMVRRTRSFIKTNYAQLDPLSNRRFLTFPDGTRSYFPDRIPRKMEYPFDPTDENDQYARLYSTKVVDIINALSLPRYGLAKYIDKAALSKAKPADKIILDNLSRAGERLRGFCRTNLFKRLESSGWSFLLSISRHILRNYIAIYAIENGLPMPIGAHISNVLDDYIEDSDIDDDDFNLILTEEQYLKKAEEAYTLFTTSKYEDKFDWIDTNYFSQSLLKELTDDAKNLCTIVQFAKNWDAQKDRQLVALFDLISETHGEEKILIFTQFADTAKYLHDNLEKWGVENLEYVTGASTNPTGLAHRFSPKSNKKADIIKGNQELRVLIATDVLSEGQNLQDAHVVLNYDLPWAIIRLIQRAGRVDRIGQQSDKIYCYSFLPEDGIETIINLRRRLTQRIKENSEVVGSDEVFFDGDPINIQDIYSEKSGILDEEETDLDVDLSSYAYQIWKNATDARPELKKMIPDLPQVSYSTKQAEGDNPQHGVILYTKTAKDNDVLTWVNTEGVIVTQSQMTILKAAACDYDTPTLPEADNHHDLVKLGLDFVHTEEINMAGTLGRKTGAKFKTFNILNNYIKECDGTLFAATDGLKQAVEAIFKYPLREFARETLNRQLKASIEHQQLAELVESLWEENKLVIKDDEHAEDADSQIICSMGLR